jgi:ferric-dicitrate binding protein FerR (iron transport regulator)
MSRPHERSIHSRRSALRLLSILPLVIAAPQGSAATRSVAAVSEVKGIAMAELGDDRRPLAVRSALHLGETLSTGDNSRLKALFARHATLSLSANARLKIDRFIADSGGTVALTSGALLADFAAKRLGRGLTVTSPYGIIGTRGTRFFAGELGENFSVFVERGAVVVRAAGQSVRLSAGEGTDIEAIGARPGPVRRWGAAKIARAMALVR